MKLLYSIGKAYREKVFVETGAEVDITGSVELPADALTPELRAHILRVIMVPRVPAEFTLANYQPSFDAARVEGVLAERVTLAEPATDADALELLRGDMRRWEAAELRRIERAQERAQERARSQQQEAERRERERLAAEREAAEGVRRDAEKRAWIKTHGSPYLKKCVAGGYNCQRAYVIERASIEHPGYVVDYNDTARWKDRSAPSEAAMDEAASLGGTVVWLTAAPSNTVPSDDEPDYGDEFQPCEAVLMQGYLGKYDLVRLM